MSKRRLALIVSLVVVPTAALIAFVAREDRRDGTWKPVPSPQKGATALTAIPHEDGIMANYHFDSAWSAFLVGAFLEIPFGGMFAASAALAWAHRRRERAEAAFDPGAPLRDGPGVVQGVVESLTEDGATPVEVRIQQRGTEHEHRGRWRYAWSETKRTVRAVPFILRRDDGIRVRVEPDHYHIAFQDTLARCEQDGDDTRTRFAELRPGERAYVTGDLRDAGPRPAPSAYRDGGGEPVLRRPAFGKMLVSTERPGTRDARFHTRWALALGLIFVFLHVVAIPTYLVLLFDGTTIYGDVTKTRTSLVWSQPKHGRGGWMPRYSIQASGTLDGASVLLEDECGAAIHSLASTGLCAKVSFRVSEHAPSIHQVGSHAKLTVGRAMILGFAAFFLPFVYLVSRASAQPWYAKKRLIDAGVGRLPGPPLG